MNERMQHQGGWAATFIVVGVVLVLGLLGGVYYVKNHMSSVADTTVTAPTASSTDKNTNKDTNTPAPTKEATGSTSKGTTATDTTKPDSSSTATPPVADPSTSATPRATSESAATQTALPQTGPSDVVVKFAAIGLVSFAATAYLRSRNDVARLSL